MKQNKQANNQQQQKQHFCFPTIKKTLLFKTRVGYAEASRYPRKLNQKETNAMAAPKSVVVGNWGVHSPLGVFTTIILSLKGRNRKQNLTLLE